MSLGLGIPVAEWQQASEKILPDVGTQILAHEAMNVEDSLTYTIGVLP
jgi:hypothetical protein